MPIATQKRKTIQIPMSDFQTVAKVGDIPNGEGRAYDYLEQVVAVFNNDGEYLAIDDMCPHMGASLATGHLEECVVACPWHGWRFDTRDGAWCDNRRIKIDTFQVRVVGDEIQVAAAVKDASDESSDDSGSAKDAEGDSVDAPPCDSCKPGLTHPAEDQNGAENG